MSYVSGVLTFEAGSALLAHRRVKMSGAAVVYAGLGEDAIGVTETAAASGAQVAVKILGVPGSVEVTAAKVLAAGAVLYGAALGKVSDASSGSAIGLAKAAATGDGSLVEMVPYSTKSTTAATVSVADANSNMTGGTVEAVLNEAMVGLKTAQYLIQPAGAITLETGAPTVVFANGAGDGFTQLTNKEVALRWNNGANPTKMAARFIIPPDLNPAADIVVHFLGAIVKAGANEADSPTITCEAYFAAAGAAMLADANCGGASGEFLTNAADAYQEKTLTIALADIPAVASVLTLIFNPTDGQLPADDFVLAGVWIEATRQHLTS